ncbi:MAG TPA: lysylphosphatidylglycerol synthase transmembrane domain-containing protein [Solirubrobacterales bacterium]|nr:lysylphosphatidylglycerol synthase transmembrane domain-containing protein [Solirubrobacterales bacterium]
MKRIGRRLVAIATSLPGRVAISVGLLAIVARSIDWGAVVDRLSGASWGWFVLATAMVLAAFVLGALRWQLLLNGAGLHPRLRDTLRAYGIGIFANNVLPTGFGGDAVRAWLIAPRGAPLARALTAVAADRGTAFSCLLPIAWLGVLLSGGEIPGSLVGLLAVISGGTVVGVLVAIAVLRRRGLGRFLPRLLRPWAAEVARTLRTYGRDRERLGEVFALGFGFQVLIVVSTWLLSEALGLGLDLEVIAVVLPLVLVATLMPISIAGFGVREGAFAALLAEVGVSSGDAVLLSLLTVASVAIASLPGGVALALRHERLETTEEILEDAYEDAPAPASRASSEPVGDRAGTPR